MASLWPWLAVAGVGALHGLNPATGWLLAAAWGVRSRDRAQALWALMPIAIGHATSVALVATAVALGLSMDRGVLQAVAGGLLIAAAAVHLRGLTARRARVRAGHAGLALWSFMMSTAHGAGLMLVPALIPLCLGDAPREISASRSLTLALAAVGVHTVAMLAVTGVIAAGVCRGFETAIALVRVGLIAPGRRAYCADGTHGEARAAAGRNQAAPEVAADGDCVLGRQPVRVEL
jgi:hypothetical protein